MALTLRYLASPAEQQLVLNWFQQRPEPPQLHPLPKGVLLHFPQFGPLLGYPTGNQSDLKRSPAVTLVHPRERRGLFWTPGEVHFLTNHLRSAFPGLHRVQMDFHGWLRTFPVVYRSPRRLEAGNGPWDYFLEGGIRNRDSEIYALPEAMTALEQGRYFVDGMDSEVRLDDVVRVLRLRGVSA